MKFIFLLLVMIHGIIHFLGFVKGFELKEVRELTLPITKLSGLVWFIAAILFLVYGILMFFDIRYAWITALLAVVLSQILIILFWKDAKFGTIPNILIFVVSMISFGYFNFQNLVKRETIELLHKNGRYEKSIVKEDDLRELPDVVKKWMVNSGITGKPLIHYGKIKQSIEMQIKPDQKNWLTAKAIQYSTIDTPAFLWYVDVKMNSFLNLKGRDKYTNGKGEMLIKLNSIFNLVNERGSKLDEGTLQRYLGEMVWFPSLALSPFIKWEEIDPYTTLATMNYKGISGSGKFHFNQSGEVVKYTALRFMGNESNAKRHEWTIRILDHSSFEGIKVPSKITSSWKLDNEDWLWLKMEVTDIKYNDKDVFNPPYALELRNEG